MRNSSDALLGDELAKPLTVFARNCQLCTAVRAALTIARDLHRVNQSREGPGVAGPLSWEFAFHFLMGRRPQFVKVFAIPCCLDR